MSPIISVIIPCFNSGKYLSEAIDSVVNYNHKYSYEIIITDDGSTDPDTILLLKNLADKGFNVLRQENKGPGSARNTSIKQAKGEFLLFLDSDNKIKGLYIDKGVEILKANNDIGVVHANPIFFGSVSESRFYSNQPFNLCNILASNYIDMCTVVRKKVWETIGGFDENKVLIGHEDWEFWIRVAKSGWKFFHLNEELFYYRITDGSLITTVDKEKFQLRLIYIFEKHIDLVVRCYLDLTIRNNELSFESKLYTDDKNRPFRSLLKFTYNKYINKDDNLKLNIE